MAANLRAFAAITKQEGEENEPILKSTRQNTVRLSEEGTAANSRQTQIEQRQDRFLYKRPDSSFHNIHPDKIFITSCFIPAHFAIFGASLAKYAF
jgi:hypothetical protein